MNTFLKRMLSTSAAILMISQGVIASDPEFDQLADAVRGTLFQNQQTILNLNKEVELRGAIIAQIEEDNKAVLDTAVAKIPAAALRDFDAEIDAKRTELTQYNTYYTDLETLTSQKSTADASVDEFGRELQTAREKVTNFVTVAHDNIEWVDADKAFKIVDGFDDGGLAAAKGAWETASAKVSDEARAIHTALNKALAANKDTAITKIKNIIGVDDGDKAAIATYFTGRDLAKVEWKTVVAQVKTDAQAYADAFQAVEDTRQAYETAQSASAEYSDLQTQVAELNTEYKRLQSLAEKAQEEHNLQVTARDGLVADIKVITDKGVTLDNQNLGDRLNREIQEIQEAKELATPRPVENQDLKDAWERHNAVYDQSIDLEEKVSALDSELQRVRTAASNFPLLGAMLNFAMSNGKTAIDSNLVEAYVEQFKEMLGLNAGTVSFNKAELKSFAPPEVEGEGKPKGGSSSSSDISKYETVTLEGLHPENKVFVEFNAETLTWDLKGAPTFFAKRAIESHLGSKGIKFGVKVNL